jgi:hypothetical protein
MNALAIGYKFSNIFHRLRGWKEELAHIRKYGITSELRATLFKVKTSKRYSLGVLSRRSVTTAGVNFMVDAFQNATEIETFNFHDCGTGGTTENVTDTVMQTPYGGARATGTQSEPAANQYRTVGTIAFTGTLAIVEHGIFSASSAGTLWDRSVFSAINVVNGDSIQFTYTLTVNSGG